MWSIERHTDQQGAPYDRRAAVYDRLVRSRAYNRLAWSTTPDAYTAFAARALADGHGPLLEAAAGSAAATAGLHAASDRETVLVDLSVPMLERAARRLAAQDAPPAAVRLVQADIGRLPFADGAFATVLTLGAAHLFADVDDLVDPLRRVLAPGGHLYLTSLVAETTRGRRYLEVLHRAGEVAPPRTAAELHAALGHPDDFATSGCMAYAVLA
jgi:SAM-dependent methyltransferase